MLDIDEFICRLANVDENKCVCFTPEEIVQLSARASDAILDQPAFLEISTPVNICGNINGQFWDLLQIFKNCGQPPKTSYLFLGNYVGEGSQSVEVICLLFALKVRYPEKFFLLRGSNEDSSVNERNGFKSDCLSRFKNTGNNGELIWSNINNTFDCLPLVAVVDCTIFCSHAGISQNLKSFDQIRNLHRPTKVPNTGLICDLLWTTFDESQNGYKSRYRVPSYSFGLDALKTFIDNLDLDLVVRGHESVRAGFEFTSNMKMVTISSTPSKSGSLCNVGAVLSLSKKHVISFNIREPTSSTT